MEDQLNRLSQRVAHLGKHYQRFLLTIENHLELLVERLEQHQMLDDVELWNMTPNPGDQMQMVAEIGADAKEKLDLLATFYSLQFLQMNLLSLDRLELSPMVRGGPMPLEIFWRLKGLTTNGSMRCISTIS